MPVALRSHIWLNEHELRSRLGVWVVNLPPAPATKGGAELSGGLFWLVFKHGENISVIIQPADHIIAARMRAMLAKVTGEFQEGHELDDNTAKKVPKAMIGRVLSRKEATALLRKLG